MFAPWAAKLIDLAQVAPGERILDVACGTGVVARLAAPRTGSAGHVVGLDFSPPMLEVARALPPVAGSPIEWVEANALAMPFPPATFDVVFCQHGLQQVPDRPAALSEMRRVLVPGGRLAIAVWSRIEGSPGMVALVTALQRHVGAEAANNRRAPFRLADAGELADLLAVAGFRDVHIHTRVEPARFSSPEALVAAQLAATPLSTIGDLTEATRGAIARDVRAMLQDYLQDDGMTVPMESHLAVGRS
jgi:SAM-dependent methyltransferase